MKVKSILVQGLNNFPNNAEFHYFMGLNEGSLGSGTSQLNYLRKAYNIQPNNPKYSYNYILMLYNSGRKKEAKNELVNALKLNTANERLLQLNAYFYQ